MIAELLEKHQFSCIIKSNLGFECPGCGTQRAIIALLKGNVFESLTIHPGVLLFMITFLMLIVQLFVQFKKGGWIIMCLFILSVAATLVNYVIRFLH